MAEILTHRRVGPLGLDKIRECAILNTVTARDFCSSRETRGFFFDTHSHMTKHLKQSNPTTVAAARAYAPRQWGERALISGIFMREGKTSRLGMGARM
jgi:hypothetical protein